MGTNYYFKTESKKLHIGKSSFGWEFLFRKNEDLGLNSRQDWLDFLYMNQDRGIIRDEFGKEESLITFAEITDSNHRQKMFNMRHLGNLKNFYEEMKKTYSPIPEKELKVFQDSDGYAIMNREFD